ncbi:hemocyte protein-glutamine gamma-glutamyltransferase-like [Limulus polyphemus]|uniref:Hemocyte protein-glutamine gamma-glutamyltransferase-like n=1 Tax=Limulus polyphemus TaxID=6850 RepID=A0ABM1BT82_LIMPO|nr:hemocyte protein-glutamine gamma-glutamyltransferase-like [Limulus polyphemus]
MCIVRFHQMSKLSGIKKISRISFIASKGCIVKLSLMLILFDLTIGYQTANEVNNVSPYEQDNAYEHHTSAYELLRGPKPVLIVRRGYPFYIAVLFKRAFNPQQDFVKLEMMFGSQPNRKEGSLIVLPVTVKNKFTKGNDHWDVRLHEHNGAVVTLQIRIPANAAVGIWKMKITSTLIISGKPVSLPNTYECKEDIYILFNPWSIDDSVYMADDQWRKEYVLNDVGKIFIGSYNQPMGRRWILGQFTEAVLPAAMFILERSRLDFTDRSDPVKIARALSALINDVDDKGVVEGKWEEPYDDGTAPWMWTGSSAILEQYLKTKGVPVKYGQCWVYAGVCNTVCRALGLPCRLVTNYVSAHDTDNTLSVDKWFDKDGDEIKTKTNDSIWNFHVWNDCWMTRPDLPTNYGGWQVVDATPQEISDGLYRSGPTSLVAVKRGEIDYLYDSSFVFSEVNARIIHWQKDEFAKGGWRKLKIIRYQIGKLIITKKRGIDDDFGNADVEDITHEYKNSKDSHEERHAFLNAIRRGGLAHVYDVSQPSKEDVYFSLQSSKNVLIGHPFVVTIMIRNHGIQRRTISLSLSVFSVYYTGTTSKKLKQEKRSISIFPSQRKTLSLRISPDEYLNKLVDYAMIKIYAIATVKETQQTWSEEEDLMLKKPKLNLEVQGLLKVGAPFMLTISFTNPLNHVLENCVFTVEAPGVTGSFYSKFRNIWPRENIVHVERLFPQRSGLIKIVVTFSSRQLTQVIGSTQIAVKG